MWLINFAVVIGYDEGTIMIKLGREVLVASMDTSGKMIWAKHNEIQTVNVKAVGADYEVSLYVIKKKKTETWAAYLKTGIHFIYQVTDGESYLWQ